MGVGVGGTGVDVGCSAVGCSAVGDGSTAVVGVPGPVGLDAITGDVLVAATLAVVAVSAAAVAACWVAYGTGGGAVGAAWQVTRNTIGTASAAVISG